MTDFFDESDADGREGFGWSFPWPTSMIGVSGTYGWRPAWNFLRSGTAARGAAGPPDGTADFTQGAWPIWLSSETIRLDVDGRYPQMTVSGETRTGFTGRAHWIADLTPAGQDTWTGPIWYRHGTTSLMPFQEVRVVVTRSWYPNQRSVSIEFSGGASSTRTRTYGWESAYFGEVEFEYDRTSDANKVTSIGTCDHPNRPASLRCENLSLETVYRRAGFHATANDGGQVALGGAGSNGTWSDAEMHDAMVAYWTRFADRPSWAMWVFWAALHDRGSRLGGVMFDDIGPNHRQGTAIFSESFISDPKGDADPDAFVARLRFWTAAHEMGHGFNLAHSWQKEHPPEWGTPWIPLVNEPESRSFMNYPYRVAGGQAAFFADFDYRFSDQELLFMRHAPRQFVQMGNADWFDDHGFEQAPRAQDGLRLELRANRHRPVFEFMEPVVLELKLANEGDGTVLVDTEAMVDGEDLTVIVKRDGTPARQWAPYTHHVVNHVGTPLAPKQARYEPLSISSGLNGNALAEPGAYTVQVALQLDQGVVVSNPFRLRVAPPRGWDEEDLAGDFFTDDVSRALALGGTRFMKSANDALENVADRMSESRAALHAKVALATPGLRDFRQLDLRGDTPEVGLVPRAVESSARELVGALLDAGDDAADTFGHVGLHNQVDHVSAALADDGAEEEAADAQRGLLTNLRHRGVKETVLTDIEKHEEELRPRPAKKSSAKKSTAKKKTGSRKK